MGLTFSVKDPELTLSANAKALDAVPPNPFFHKNQNLFRGQ